MGCQGETGLQEDSLTPKTTEFLWGSESGTYGPRDATHPDKDTGAVPVTSCIPAGDSPTPEPAFQPPRCPTVPSGPWLVMSSAGSSGEQEGLQPSFAGCTWGRLPNACALGHLWNESTGLGPASLPAAKGGGEGMDGKVPCQSRCLRSTCGAGGWVSRSPHPRPADYPPTPRYTCFFMWVLQIQVGLGGRIVK